MNQFGIIYRVTSPSGKVYIGQTRSGLKQRKRTHLSLYGKKRKFTMAIEKYGEKLVWEILYDQVPFHLLGAVEIWAIANHNSFENGYNSTTGGQGISGIGNHAGHKHSQESKRKMSESQKGHVRNLGSKRTEESKKRMSLAHIGENWTEERKAKLRGNRNSAGYNKKRFEAQQRRRSLERLLREGKI